jgi:hypothetical protein
VQEVEHDAQPRRVYLPAPLRLSQVGVLDAAEQVALLVHDTTGVNYNGQRKTEGNGYIGDKATGVNIHACLAVTPDGLVPGLLYQTGYNRPEPRNGTLTKKEPAKRPIDEKERGRRLPAMEAVSLGIPDGTKIIHVCGREGTCTGCFARR